MVPRARAPVRCVALPDGPPCRWRKRPPGRLVDAARTRRFGQQRRDGEVEGGVMHDHAFPVEAAFDALGLAEPETEDPAVWHVVAAMVSAVEAGLHEIDVDSGDGRALDAAGASRPGVVRRRARSTCLHAASLLLLNVARRADRMRDRWGCSQEMRALLWRAVAMNGMKVMNGMETSIQLLSWMILLS